MFYSSISKFNKCLTHSISYVAHPQISGVFFCFSSKTRRRDAGCLESNVLQLRRNHKHNRSQLSDHFHSTGKSAKTFGSTNKLLPSLATLDRSANAHTHSKRARSWRVSSRMHPRTASNSRRNSRSMQCLIYGENVCVCVPVCGIRTEENANEK